LPPGAPLRNYWPLEPSADGIGWRRSLAHVCHCWRVDTADELVAQPSALRVRWEIAAFSALIPAVLFGVSFGLVTHGAGTGAAFGVILLAILTPIARRRSLELTADGLIVDRGRYRLSGRWADVSEIERRRRGLLVAEELVFSSTHLEFAPGVSERFRLRVLASGADKRVQISVYQRNWRKGPVGAAVEAR
jgi:hypothetical protein